MEITFFKVYICLYLGFPGGSAVNNTCAMQEPQETQIRSLGQEDPLEEGMATHSSILAWRTPLHGQRRLVGYSPWGRKDLDATKATQHTHT